MPDGDRSRGLENVARRDVGEVLGEKSQAKGAPSHPIDETGRDAWVLSHLFKPINHRDAFRQGRNGALARWETRESILPLCRAPSEGAS